MPFNEIEITPQPLTGLRRKARRFETVTHSDGELTLYVDVIFMDQDGTDLVEKFRTMIGDGEGQISTQQFAELEKKYFPSRIAHTTRGSFVNPATGAIVAEDTEGAMPEAAWFRSLTNNGHIKPMLINAGLLSEGEDRHVIIEEAFERLVMLRLDSMKRY